eukprot:7200002-Pyramimonas_sp.AAC.1
MLAGPKRGEQWEKVGNWTQGGKRGRISWVLSAPLPLLTQEDPYNEVILVRVRARARVRVSLPGARRVRRAPPLGTPNPSPRSSASCPCVSAETTQGGTNQLRGKSIYLEWGPIK